MYFEETPYFMRKLFYDTAGELYDYCFFCSLIVYHCFRCVLSYIVFLLVSGYITFFIFCPILIALYYRFPKRLKPLATKIFLLKEDSNLLRSFLSKFRWFLFFCGILLFLISQFIVLNNGLEHNKVFSSTLYFALAVSIRVTRIMFFFYFKYFASFFSLYYYNFSAPNWAYLNTLDFVSRYKHYFYSLYLPCKYYIKRRKNSIFPNFVYILFVYPLRKLFFGINA